MKNLTFTLLIIISLAFLNSCKKFDSLSSYKVFKPQFLEPKSSQTVDSYIDSLISDYKIALKTHPHSTDSFSLLFEDLQDKNCYVSTDSLTSNEEYFLCLYLSYLDTSNNYNEYTQFVSSLITKIDTTSALIAEEKDRLLKLIGGHKVMFDYMVELIGKGKYFDWDKIINDCIREKLSHIFDDGTIVEQLAFISGLPVSFNWIVADCTVSAIRQYYGW